MDEQRAGERKPGEAEPRPKGERPSTPREADTPAFDDAETPAMPTRIRGGGRGNEPVE